MLSKNNPSVPHFLCDLLLSLLSVCLSGLSAQPIHAQATLTIENLHIDCNNGQSELVWQSQGEPDYFEVAGSVVPEMTNDTIYLFDASHAFRELNVKAVKDSVEGKTNSVTLITESVTNIVSQGLVGSLHTHDFASCSSMYFNFANNSPFRPLSFLITINNMIYIEQANETLSVALEVPRIGTWEVDTTISTFWDCGRDQPGMCPRRHFCTELTSQPPAAFPFEEGLENQGFGCAFELDNSTHVPLHWEHPLISNENAFYPGAFYEITLTSNGQTTNFTTPVFTETSTEDPTTRAPYVQRQNYTLEVDRDKSYRITITPVYPLLDVVVPYPVDPRCVRQSITFDLTIPPKTLVQVSEERATLFLLANVSSGYRAIVLRQDDSTQVTEHTGETGEQDFQMVVELESGQNYMATITYNGTDTIPCRTDTVFFPRPSSFFTPNTTDSSAPPPDFTNQTTEKATFVTTRPRAPVIVGTPFSEIPSSAANYCSDNTVNCIIFSIDGVIYLAIGFTITGIVAYCVRRYKQSVNTHGSPDAWLP